MNPQTGIFEEGLAHHCYLEFSVPQVSGRLPGKALFDRPTPRVHETYAFSGSVLSGIDHRLQPEGLEPFDGIDGVGGFAAPSTQTDLFIWIQSNQRDEVFARSLAWVETMRDCAELKYEELGFLFRDSRDLTGFIDGSANPKADKRFDAALIQSGPHAGGSFVFTQRWQHDLGKFHSLPVNEQEQVIGRTKKDSIELEGDDMPPDSHVSRTDITHDNEAVKIYRRSTPTGGVLSPGLFFLAFSADQQRFQWLLDSMFGNTGDDQHDRLLSFSKPITGSYYFAPNLETLSRIFD